MSGRVNGQRRCLRRQARTAEARAGRHERAADASIEADPVDNRLKELLRGDLGDLRDEALHAEALGLLRVHPAMGEARERTDAVARQAQLLLAPLAIGLADGSPAQEALTALSSLVEGVVNRAG